MRMSDDGIEWGHTEFAHRLEHRNQFDPDERKATST